MSKPPFQIGDTVFVAHASAFVESRVPCPVCFGKLSVELILGNGEIQPVTCEYCSHGFNPPSGTVIKRVPGSWVTEATVTGLSLSDDEWKVATDRVYSPPLAHIFASAEEAEPTRLRLHAEAEASAQRSFESQFTNARGKVSWTAGYHRNEVAKLERKLAWHRAKLSAAKKPEKGELP